MLVCPGPLAGAVGKGVEEHILSKARREALSPGVSAARHWCGKVVDFGYWEVKVLMKNESATSLEILFAASCRSACRTTATRLGIEKMTIAAAATSLGDKLCEAPCFNTNKFAPGAYQVTCDQCHGRRGHFRIGEEWVGAEWVECSKCLGTGSVTCPRCRGTGKHVQV